MKIITNNKPRELLHGYQLTPKELSDFDYFNSEDDAASAQFFRFKGNVYHLGDIMRIDQYTPPQGFENWHGYAGDSYFSGILVKFTDDNEAVIVGRYYS